MKLFKYLCMGMVSLMLCAGFTSCGGDDEPTGGNGGGDSSEITPDKPDKPQLPSLDKRIHEITEIFDNGKHRKTVTFFYNEKGELTKCTDLSGWTKTYVWNGNSITCELDTRKNTTIYTMDDKGLVTSSSSSQKDPEGNQITISGVYNYNNNHLKKLEFTTSSIHGESVASNIYRWDGAIYLGHNYKTQTDTRELETVTELIISGNRAKGACIVTAYPISEDWLFCAFPEKSGFLTEEMPFGYTQTDTETYFGDEWNGTKRQVITYYIKMEYNYSDVKTDQDGYITSVTVKLNSEFYKLYSFKDLNKDGKISGNELNVKDEAGTTKNIVSTFNYSWEKK